PAAREKAAFETDPDQYDGSCLSLTNHRRICSIHEPLFTQPLAAGNSRCPCQLRLIYEIVRHIFISTSRSAAVPELWTLGVIRVYVQTVHFRPSSDCSDRVGSWYSEFYPSTFHAFSPGLHQQFEEL
ncbi:MAG: hypothetical protein WAO02_01180, partial [Verrucomicrobiia bacterium]